MGAGRSDVACAIFGLAPADSGDILVHGHRVSIRHPRDAIELGIGMVTEDRKGHGIVPDMAVGHNATLAGLRAYCRGPVVRHASEEAAVAGTIREYAIKTDGARQAVSQLSGGNQQKVVIARALLPAPDIVILDEPTRGIDIGAKAEVHAIVAELTCRGKAVILVSSELPELLALCDRVLVMRQGTVTAELDPKQTTQAQILEYAIPI